MRVKMAMSFQKFFLSQRPATRNSDFGPENHFKKNLHSVSPERPKLIAHQFEDSLWHLMLLVLLAVAPMFVLAGCAGLVSAGGTNSSQSLGSIQVSPASFNFGTTTVGKKASQTATVSNTGTVSVNIAQASLSSSQFAITGLTMPMTLPAGKSGTFQVWFDPTAAGNASGTFMLQTDNGVSSEQVQVAGVASAAPQQISLSTTSLNLGSAALGSVASSPLTVNNVGGTNLVVSLVSASGAPFGVTGITTPNTVLPGASVSMTVTFSPTATGAASGTLSITSNDPQTPTAIVTLSGTGTAGSVAPSITAQPASQSVTAGQTATFTVVAAGTAPLNYQWQKNGANIAGATTGSYTTPATATTDSGSTFDVVVTNTAGSITSNAATLTVTAAPVAPSITTQPANQTVTAGQTATFTVVAAGTAPLTYQWQKNGVNISGATSASYTTPATTTTDSGSTFDVVVTNTAGSITSNVATLTVTAAPAPAIQLSSSSINFGNDVVGTQTSQALIITNTGTATLNITQVNETGSAFSVSGFTLPISVAAGKQTTITVAFQPVSTGAASGSISIVSNAPTSPTPVSLSGTGVAATLILGINPTGLTFGNVTTGTSSTAQDVTVTNTGNTNITISQIALSGAGYSMTNGTTPVTLTPSQNVVLAVQFSPTTVGAVNGSISITSNANGSPATVTLSGTGVAPVQHSAALSWTASTSSVSGYNVYRGTVSGGPYTKVNSALITTASYTDTTVQAGTTYYYVTTAVDSSGNESIDSNEVTAAIP